MNFRDRIAWAGLALGLLAGVAGCREAAPSPAMPPPSVVVAEPMARDVTEWDYFTGRLQAVQEVEVRARVGGYLDEIHFKDGDLVDEGELLFTIDPRPYEATRDQARARVEQAQAQLELARREQNRSAQLVRRNAETQEEYDIKASQVRQAEADVAAAEAALEAAELDVEFCTIEAPVSGRIGRHLITEGNLVNGEAGQATMLTTIVSLDPIHVYFDANERDYLKYVRQSQEGTRPSSREFATPISVQLADEEGFPHPGTMDFVDNRVDQFTGTMRGRAILPNPEGVLTPGLFAKVRLPGSPRYRATLLPDGAIVRDQSQTFVFLVSDEGEARRRQVEIGRAVAGLRIVRDGVGPEDRVIIEGIQAVRDGVEVRAEPGAIEVDEELWAREMPAEGGYPPNAGAVGFAAGRRYAP
ncbi:efflux RND transporter periplasmic adaptor subunit [Tautonia plasticadhaerens]|uniref:Multidrug resistance protein MdtE n=1 Tax=Tautonia plasticadhaerens TaxID=2527974 RepID=A0A518H4F4_9BACT|nr:efflux RND transporter periplasmic adaptor subunit [Tautonia plasticadhaerens]QDV35721.1 Multidrug resistance protein MdtE precursor [Tautonia plasticadhaerens]